MESPFSEQERSRYNRHLIMPQFGPQAQKALREARVLVIGAGGLGSPALLYLAAAGAGSIGIIDFDRVEDSNLQRQVLYNTQDIGAPKAITAEQKLKQLNPYINITSHQQLLSVDNAIALFTDYDLILDGTDNFATRYLINDVCVYLDKPFVYGAIYQFEGQVSVFNLKYPSGATGPDYRDLYPFPPSADSVPNCAEAGVLGVLPGIIGTMQALEAIKVITGIGEPLSGRLCIFDALYFDTRIVKIKSNPGNPLHQNKALVKTIPDYNWYCDQQGTTVQEITPLELVRLLEMENIQLIDVRTEQEYQQQNIHGEWIPLERITEDPGKIASDKKVVVHCQSGSRSRSAIIQLQEKYKLRNLYNLKGGLEAFLKQFPR